MLIKHYNKLMDEAEEKHNEHVKKLEGEIEDL